MNKNGADAGAVVGIVVMLLLTWRLGAGVNTDVVFCVGGGGVVGVVTEVALLYWCWCCSAPQQNTCLNWRITKAKLCVSVCVLLLFLLLLLTWCLYYIIIIIILYYYYYYIIIIIIIMMMMMMMIVTITIMIVILRSLHQGAGPGQPDQVRARRPQRAPLQARARTFTYKRAHAHARARKRARSRFSNLCGFPESK